VASLFVALGETKLLMKLNILTLIIGVPLGFILIPQFGIIGLILATLVVGIPHALIAAYLAWRRYGG